MKCPAETNQTSSSNLNITSQKH